MLVKKAISTALSSSGVIRNIDTKAVSVKIHNAIIFALELFKYELHKFFFFYASGFRLRLFDTWS